MTSPSEVAPLSKKPTRRSVFDGPGTKSVTLDQSAEVELDRLVVLGEPLNVLPLCVTGYSLTCDRQGGYQGLQITVAASELLDKLGSPM